MRFKPTIVLALLLALSLPAGAQNDIAQKAECQGGMAIYISSKNKVYLGLPEQMAGRKLLIGGAVSAVSDPGAANIGQMASGPVQCVIVSLEDSLVVLRRPQLAGSSSEADYAKAMERNFASPILRRMAPLERSDGRIVFDITSLVTKAAPRGNDFKPGAEDGTSWFSDPKAFEDNASVKLNQSFEANGLGGKTTVSMVSTVSVLALPAEGMRPRLQDARIGTFHSGSATGENRYELGSATDGLRPYRLANRWRLHLTDTLAWLQGKTVSVKNPIIWWIDDSFPEVWKQPVKDGVLAWNAAFEAFGLKDVLQVRDFPADDPSFDPDNLKFNCIRFVPNATANAMGPSWADPETGEIVSATVLMFNDVVRLLNNWRFVQTAQTDERVRCKKMPDEIISEALVYAVSHEIGHTLGLLHNMAASAAIPVDSLRSATFTAVHGTTASIMDYARFNYVAQPQDKGVRLVPPALGEYDRYAIEWLYKPVPGAKDMWEETRAAEALIDRHEGDPFYRYGPQQPAMAAVQYDPSARTQDLGDDAVRAGGYGVENLKYILPRINGWIEDDADYSHRRELYKQLCAQYGKYLSNAASMIGGVKLYRTKTGRKCIPVEAGKQKEALRWVVDQVCNSAWLDCPELTGHFGLHNSQSHSAAASMAQYLAFTAPVAVATASENGSDYDVEAYFNDLYDRVFSGKLTAQRKSLQRALVTLAVKRSAPAKPAESFNDSFCFGEWADPGQQSVDIAASSEVAVYRAAFLEKVRSYSARNKRNPHFAYLYSLTK